MIDLMEKFGSITRFEKIIRGEPWMRDFDLRFFLFREVADFPERAREFLNIFEDLNYFVSLISFEESSL